MTYVITEACIGVKDRSCVDVCPVDCIHEEPEVDRMLYINPDECIDCGACVPACPYNAIFPEHDVPAAYTAKGGEYVSRVGLTGHYEGTNEHGVKVILDTVKQLEAGEVVDLTADIQPNYAYFESRPGYKANDTDEAKAARGG